MSSSVKIPPKDDGSLDFDLAEVLAAVGRHDELIWRLRGARLLCVDRPEPVVDRWEALADESFQPDGVTLTWDEIEAVSLTCQQVIDGTFTGYRDNEPVLQLAAIDSSFWIIWATDSLVIERVRRAFPGVTDYDEPDPLPLR